MDSSYISEKLRLYILHILGVQYFLIDMLDIDGSYLVIQFCFCFVSKFEKYAFLDLKWLVRAFSERIQLLRMKT